MKCEYNHDVASQPLSPEDHLPLMQMKYGPTLKDNFAEFGGLDWFNAEVNFIQTLGDIKFANTIKFTWECTEDAFDQVEVTDVQYDAEADCPARINWECIPGCIGTAPCWKEDEVRFDKMYRIGAYWCPLLEKVTYGTLEERFNKAAKAQQKVYGINAWNYLVCNAVNNPARTLNPVEADCYPVHYIEAGDARANAAAILMQVIGYMKSIYQGNVEFGIFAHRYLEQDLITLNDYHHTGITNPEAIDTVLVQGGWRAMAPFSGKLFGETIYIAPDTLDLYIPATATTEASNRNPFLNADGTKYYVLLTSKRSFLTGVEPLSDMKHYEPTCDSKVEGYEQIFIGYNKIIRPEEIFVIAFDVPCAL